jgi:hypothetical protein
MKTLKKLKFRSYSSVDEMVKLTLGSRWLKRMKQRLKHTEVVDQLVLARLRAGLSQTDLATRMKCTQSRVSKIEDSLDAQLSLKDIYEYAGAVGVGCEFRIDLNSRGHVGKVTRDACKCTRGDKVTRGHGDMGRGKDTCIKLRGHGDTGTRGQGTRVKLARGQGERVRSTRGDKERE